MPRSCPASASRGEILQTRLQSSGDLKAVEAEEKVNEKTTRHFPEDGRPGDEVKRRKVVWFKFLATMTTLAALAVSLELLCP